jgi:hypothetical protein
MLPTIQVPEFTPVPTLIGGKSKPCSLNCLLSSVVASSISIADLIANYA